MSVPSLPRPQRYLKTYDYPVNTGSDEFMLMVPLSHAGLNSAMKRYVWSRLGMPCSESLETNACSRGSYDKFDLDRHFLTTKGSVRFSEGGRSQASNASSLKHGLSSASPNGHAAVSPFDETAVEPFDMEPARSASGSGSSHARISVSSRNSRLSRGRSPRIPMTLNVVSA
jgi:hypothetical protein